MIHIIVLCLFLIVLIIGSELHFRKSNGNGREQQFKELITYTKSYELRHKKRLARMLKIKTAIDYFTTVDYNTNQGGNR